MHLSLSLSLSPSLVVSWSVRTSPAADGLAAELPVTKTCLTVSKTDAVVSCAFPTAVLYRTWEHFLPMLGPVPLHRFSFLPSLGGRFAYLGQTASCGVSNAFGTCRIWTHAAQRHRRWLAPNHNLALPPSISSQSRRVNFAYAGPFSQYRLSVWSGASGSHGRFFKTSFACLNVAPVSILKWGK